MGRAGLSCIIFWSGKATSVAKTGAKLVCEQGVLAPSDSSAVDEFCSNNLEVIHVMH